MAKWQDINVIKFHALLRKACKNNTNKAAAKVQVGKDEECVMVVTAGAGGDVYVKWLFNDKEIRRKLIVSLTKKNEKLRKEFDRVFKYCAAEGGQVKAMEKDIEEVDEEVGSERCTGEKYVVSYKLSGRQLPMQSELVISWEELKEMKLNPEGNIGENSDGQHSILYKLPGWTEGKPLYMIFEKQLGYRIALADTQSTPVLLPLTAAQKICFCHGWSMSRSSDTPPVPGYSDLPFVLVRRMMSTIRVVQGEWYTYDRRQFPPVFD